jgi:hypothetical protein
MVRKRMTSPQTRRDGRPALPSSASIRAARGRPFNGRRGFFSRLVRAVE